MAFDLLASEYGWTDQVIGELPLTRLRQITSAIQLRKFQESRIENGRTAWMARNITSFIAMGYMMEKGQENTALAAAQRLTMDEIDQALLDESYEAAENAPKENAKGSYEKFMTFANSATKRG